MYSIGITALMLGVCIKTLRRWEKKRKITCVRTLGGHQRFPVQKIKRLILKSSYKQEISHPHSSFKSTCAIYGRVSSHKQSKRGDLERQVEQLKEHAKKISLKVNHVYKDVASGWNTRRKNLWKMVRDARKNCFSHVLLTYKVRLTRTLTNLWECVNAINQELIRQLQHVIMDITIFHGASMLKVENLKWSRHSRKQDTGNWLTFWQTHWFFSQV